MAMRMVKVAPFGWALTAPETAECGALLAVAFNFKWVWRTFGEAVECPCVAFGAPADQA